MATLKFRTVSSDMDTRVSEAKISGRFTKKRFKTISSFIRKTYNLGRLGFCGHDFDCCGCLCGQYAEINYLPKESAISIQLSESFNY